MSRTLRTVAIALAVLLVGWLAWYLVQPLYLQSKARGDVASGLAAGEKIVAGNVLLLAQQWQALAQDAAPGTPPARAEDTHKDTQP